MIRRAIAAAALWVAVGVGCVRGDSVSLLPIADANLFENSPDANFGDAAQLQIGLNGRGNRGRGLYRFDLAAAGIPPGSIIESADLKVHVTAAGEDAIATTHRLHRVRLGWSEDGASWCAREIDGYWTVPGGGLGTDFDPVASASTEIGAVGEYSFPSTPAMVSDLQRWLDDSMENNGWLLLSANESIPSNTRRIGAREAVGSEESEATYPKLTINFEPFGITEVERKGDGSVLLSWSGGRPPFEIDSSADGETWQAVPGSSVTERTASVGDQFGTGLLRVRDRAEATAVSARYRVDWQATWSAATHPTNFPGGAHFSNLIGATHHDGVSFWEPGGIATEGIERMAETGSTSVLSSEINAAISTGAASAVLGGFGIGSPGGTGFEFDVSQTHSLVTLVTMIAPSPDWFVGVHGVDLFADGSWVDSLTIALDPYDAGTDAGTTYTSSNSDNNEPISRITGSPFLDGTKVRPLGTFTFTRLQP